MTVTDNDFEQRLRRELAELANVPPDPSPELAVSRRRRRPLTTVAGALVVVLVLVTASSWSHGSRIVARQSRYIRVRGFTPSSSRRPRSLGRRGRF